MPITEVYIGNTWYVGPAMDPNMTIGFLDMNLKIVRLQIGPCSSFSVRDKFSQWFLMHLTLAGWFIIIIIKFTPYLTCSLTFSPPSLFF